MLPDLLRRQRRSPQPPPQTADSRYRHAKGASKDYSSHRGSDQYFGGRYSDAYNSYRSSAEYMESVDDGYFSSHRGSADHRRSNLGMRSSHPAQARSSHVSSSYYSDGFVPPAPLFKSAWERTRDEFYEAAREVCIGGDERGQAAPEWVRRAMERKEEHDHNEKAKMRTSDAKWAARLEVTEKQLADEQQRLRAIAEERELLEKRRARLELHQRARDLVPPTTYDPVPPPVTFPWTEENREQMHGLTLKRYEAESAQKQAARRKEMLKRAAEEEAIEQSKYEYMEEFYFLDKGPRLHRNGPLSGPTWKDVEALKAKRRQMASRAPWPQGRAKILR